MRKGHSKQARTHIKPVELIVLLTIASLMAHLPSLAGEYTSFQSLAQTVAINQPLAQGASLPQPLAAQL
jgi:ABC-type Na+ efflux pump permease subunit